MSRVYCSLKCSNNSDSVKLKKIKTCQEKYGVDYALQNKEVQKRLKDNYKKKSGYENPSQNPKVKLKKIKTCQEKYGVDYALQNKEVQNQKIKTCQEKYGVDNPSQIHISKGTLKKLNNSEWLTDQNHILKKNCTQIAKELGDIKPCAVGEYFHKYNVEIKTKTISQGEKDLNEFISSIHSKPILENDRSVISPKELDIYLPDLNIAFEYNGEYWHKESSVEGMGVPLGYHRTKTSLCRTKGIKLYHIWERHWANNQEKMKQTIINIINNHNELIEYLENK